LVWQSPLANETGLNLKICGTTPVELFKK